MYDIFIDTLSFFTHRVWARRGVSKKKSLNFFTHFKRTLIELWLIYKYRVIKQDMNQKYLGTKDNAYKTQT